MIECVEKKLRSARLLNTNTKIVMSRNYQDTDNLMLLKVKSIC